MMRPNGHTNVWKSNPNLVGQMKDLWDQKYSWEMIAQNLGHGLTRYAVKRKIDRLGWNTSGEKHVPVVTKQMGPKLKKPAGLANIFRFNGGEKIAPKFFVPDLDAPEPIGPWNDFKEKACRWPHGDPGNTPWRYCGHPIDGEGCYCPYHSKLRLAKPPKDESREAA